MPKKMNQPRGIVRRGMAEDCVLTHLGVKIPSTLRDDMIKAIARISQKKPGYNRSDFVREAIASKVEDQY